MMPFEELEHTADWSIRVTAGDFGGLLAEAARGMYSLMHLELARDDRVSRQIEVDGIDRETQLVAFLDELLFHLAHDREAYDRFDVAVQGELVSANVRGCAVTGQAKEIKAVTFHGLEIVEGDGRLEATIIFDV